MVKIIKFLLRAITNLSHLFCKQLRPKIYLLFALSCSSFLSGMEKGWDIQNNDTRYKPKAPKKIDLMEKPPSREEIVINRVGNYLHCRDFIILGMLNKNFKAAQKMYTFFGIDTCIDKQTVPANILLTDNRLLSYVITKDCFKFSLHQHDLDPQEKTLLHHAIESYQYLNKAIVMYIEMKKEENIQKDPRELQQLCENKIRSTYLMFINNLIIDPDIDINKQNTQGDTPLHCAIKLYKPRPTGKLLEYQKQKTDPTYLKMIEKIVQHPNIAINTVNNEGRTALDYTWKDTVIRLLKQYGGHSGFFIKYQKPIFICSFSGILVLVYFLYPIPKLMYNYLLSTNTFGHGTIDSFNNGTSIFCK